MPVAIVLLIGASRRFQALYVVTLRVEVGRYLERYRVPLVVRVRPFGLPSGFDHAPQLPCGT